MLYLSLRQYEYVTAIARHGSLTAAANEVNVSQPALSTALSRIESHLDKTLFLRRKGASLVLTPEGRTFVEQATALLDQAAIVEQKPQIQPRSKHLSLGCFVDLAPFLLSPALHMMRRRFPDIALHYRVDGFEALTAAMTGGHVDLAITYDLGLDAGFDRRVLDRAVPCALVPPDHPIAACPDIGLADLARQPLILFQDGLSAQHVLTLFRGLGLRPHVVHRAASLEIMRSLAANGEGIGISYTRPPGGLSYDGRPVRAIPIHDPCAAEPIILTRHGTAPADPLVAEVTDALERDIGTGPC